MAFRFKQFTVEDDRSTLRVGTDAMLLGAWADPGQAKRILDIGSGCGVLSLMMAQRSSARIDAIEIDPMSARQAAENFRRSPWAEQLTSIHSSLEKFTSGGPDAYDFIITNPPFFQGHLKSSSMLRNMAKHDVGIDLRTLILCIKKVLAPEGRVSLIYPYSFYGQLKNAFGVEDFVPSRVTAVRSGNGRAPGRILAEFCTKPFREPIRSEITILGRDAKYTGDYLELTREYHSF